MSVGRAGRRIAALCIDWGLAYLIATGFFQQNSMATLAIFAVTQILGELVIGGSVGHRVLGLRLIPLEGGYIGLWRPVVRTLLLCLFIPALVWDSDQRGFHDKVAGTVLVRFTRQG